MRPETRTAMEMLFSAKWNLPTAAKHCRLTQKEMKITDFLEKPIAVEVIDDKSGTED